MAVYATSDTLEQLKGKDSSPFKSITMITAVH